ncbi:unnamed protein product [Moneuplotes crassus]|uniref:Uncharacterized protein n=2 Tax=Euplotes crassus TaxID=5936 RepID=A0AAD1UMX2_EUPCR|nr:unnamed protein product [Moneuplotes crassus]
MASMQKDIESYKKLLKGLKGGAGEDLYGHLVEVFGHLMRHYPQEALDKIEEVSYLCKNKQEVNIEEFLKITEEIRFKTGSEANAEYSFKAGKLFEAPVLEEDEEPPEKAPVGNVPDLLTTGRIFEWAGITFGDKEYFLLQKSLAKLAEKSGATKVRFWGKIYGTQKDYYIAEGVKDAEEEGEGDEEKPTDFEPRGTGVNQFCYWVAHDALSEWTQLPDLFPKYLKTSRNIKISFAGDLEKDIITNPFFHGKEKHYLRAQIARIHHGTTLVPKGLYRPTEDDAKEIEADEPEDEENKYTPQTENQILLSNWSHYPKGILQNCRTQHMDPEPEEDDERDPEDILKEIEAKDPYDARLKFISEDNEIEHGFPAWNIRLHGDKERQKTIRGKTEHNGTVVLKSNRWPGSVTVWKGVNWHQIYVGNGHKYEMKNYFPTHPPYIPVDPEDIEEHPEPNPQEVEAPPAKEGEGEGEGDKEGENNDE